MSKTNPNDDTEALARDAVKNVLAYVEGWLFGLGYDSVSEYLRDPDAVEEIVENMAADDCLPDLARIVCPVHPDVHR